MIINIKNTINLYIGVKYFTNISDIEYNSYSEIFASENFASLQYIIANKRIYFRSHAFNYLIPSTVSSIISIISLTWVKE